MPIIVPETHMHLQTVLPKRLVYFLKREALERGVTLRTLIEQVLRTYLQSKGIVFDEKLEKGS